MANHQKAHEQTARYTEQIVQLLVLLYKGTEDVLK